MIASKPENVYSVAFEGLDVLVKKLASSIKPVMGEGDEKRRGRGCKLFQRPLRKQKVKPP